MSVGRPGARRSPRPAGWNCSASGDEAPEYGLFVVWEQARRDEREILADLARRFRLIQAYEIRWTPALVRRNYERFYSDLEVRGVYHEINKGAGSFVAATLIDPHPVYDRRQTSRGPRTVNTNFHDAKLEYRDRVGHLGLHCSESAAETRRDLVMLLGLDVCQLDVEVPLEPWDGQVERIEIDIAGPNGWDSESDLLRSLNAFASYVVLGAPPGGAASLFGGAGDPQLLTLKLGPTVPGTPGPGRASVLSAVGVRRSCHPVLPGADGSPASHRRRPAADPNIGGRGVRRPRVRLDAIDRSNRSDRSHQRLSVETRLLLCVATRTDGRAPRRRKWSRAGGSLRAGNALCSRS